ncbi:alpha/beta fold hydrolase [Teichococcus vastitatis]|uniref:alpha/beta fold hydrolase n=1 Tax=Teichococcus vastitatis TaxID=2307076 RepID=UPI00240F5573|nr:alpha/beta fold hydrolase [Pseudoroseomonas vastitatis]
MAALLPALLAPGLPPARATGYPDPGRANGSPGIPDRPSAAETAPCLHQGGEPTGQPVLVLHGTNGSSASALTAPFAKPLFGSGGSLDARKCFNIIPDSIGAGRPAKPSDGMRARFPDYNDDDMVLAQCRLVTEGLGIRHLRLLLGNSMGGMHASLWGTTYSEMADALVPMASQLTEMASRNGMLQRMISVAMRNDPDWKGGEYTTQPRAVQMADSFFGIAISGGTLAFQAEAQAPTREAADRLLDARLKAPLNGDANDVMYRWNALREYNPQELERIRVPVLAINSAADERSPPETGLMEQALARMPMARLHLIPASSEPRGHGTTGFTWLWAAEMGRFLTELPEPAAIR